MLTNMNDGLNLAMELGSGKIPRASLLHAASVLADYAPEAQANANAAVLWYFSRFAKKTDMHAHHARLAKLMNAERRKGGLPMVRGVSRSDLSLLIDCIWTALDAPEIASRLAGKSPAAVLLAKREELV